MDEEFWNNLYTTYYGLPHHTGLDFYLEYGDALNTYEFFSWNQKIYNFYLDMFGPEFAYIYYHFPGQSLSINNPDLSVYEQTEWLNNFLKTKPAALSPLSLVNRSNDLDLRNMMHAYEDYCKFNPYVSEYAFNSIKGIQSIYDQLVVNHDGAFFNEDSVNQYKRTANLHHFFSLYNMIWAYVFEDHWIRDLEMFHLDDTFGWERPIEGFGSGTFLKFFGWSFKDARAGMSLGLPRDDIINKWVDRIPGVGKILFNIYFEKNHPYFWINPNITDPFGSYYNDTSELDMYKLLTGTDLVLTFMKDSKYWDIGGLTIRTAFRPLKDYRAIEDRLDVE